MKIVPPGAPIAKLETEARSRGWRIEMRDERVFPNGKEHYFGRGCRYRGGASAYAVIAEFDVPTTTIESVWMFDRANRIADVCVRRTVDGP